jgi:hypothetical protein
MHAIDLGHEWGEVWNFKEVRRSQSKCHNELIMGNETCALKVGDKAEGTMRMTT